MKGRDGFVQAYNAQAAVDATAQVIVAHHLTNSAADQVYGSETSFQRLT
jgi:hypothetical protein